MRPALHGGGFGGAELAGDVRVGCRGEQREVRLNRRLRPAQAAAERAAERGDPDLERGPEFGDVLARDRVALRGERHRRAQGHRGGMGDILLGRASQPSRRGKPDRGVGIARIRYGGLGERGGKLGSERCGPGPEGGPGQGRE